MPWWWSKRETGSPYQHADQLYDESVRLSHIPGSERDALNKALDADRVLRPLLAPQRGGVDEVRRRLAKALWRQSSLWTVLDPPAALAPGREGVALAKEVLAALSPAHAAFDATLRELVVAMNDLSQAAGKIEQLDEREALLQEALPIARRSQGPAAQQALATTLQNLAHHQLEALEKLMRQGQLPRTLDAARAAIALTEEAVAIRRRLCTQARKEDYYFWELANSCGQLGQALFAFGTTPQERQRAQELMTEASESLRSLHGPSVDSLRARLTEQHGLMRHILAELPKRSDTPAGEASLSGSAKCLLKLSCLLDPDDRSEQLLRLWHPDQLRAAGLPVNPTSFDEAMTELMRQGLVTRGLRLSVPAEIQSQVCAQISQEDQDQFARDISRLWYNNFVESRTLGTRQAVRAGIACGLYMRRLKGYEPAFDFLAGDVLDVACYSREASQVLLHMQLTAALSEDRSLRERCDDKVLWLARAHQFEGNLDEAWTTIERGMAFVADQQLGVGRLARWREQRLELMFAQSRHRDVLNQYEEVLESVARAHTPEEAGERSTNVLNIAAGAAKGEKQWQLALDLNRKILDGVRERAGTAEELAHYEVGDAAALMELGQLDAADALLTRCQKILGPEASELILSECAIVASRRGNNAAALAFKREVLQKQYQQHSPPNTSLALSHHNYALELIRMELDPAEACSHFFAAALIYSACGSESASAALVEQLAIAPLVSVLPESMSEIATLVERTPNVPFSVWLTETESRGVKSVHAIGAALLSAARKH